MGKQIRVGNTELSIPEQRFVDAFLQTSSVRKAAIESGVVSERNAWNWIKRPNIIAAIEAGQREIAMTGKGSAEWIREQAIAIVEIAMNAREVRDSRGNVLPGIWKADLKAAIPALSLLARQHPEFSEKHEITGDLRIRLEALQAVATMSPDELRRLAELTR